MAYDFHANDFKAEYIESEIQHTVLWENHCHAQYEMIAVVDGDVTVMLEGQTYRLQSNQVIIIPPLFYHSVTANGTGTYKRITALFGIDAIPREIQQAFDRQGRSAAVPSHQTEKMKTICQKKDQAFFAPLLYSLMVELFYETLQVRQDPAIVEIDDFLQKALPYIDKHLHERILLDDLARVTNRSKSSFCHLFEEKMKISPKQYILQKKLALANKLIDEGVPRTSAAMQVGYENYSNFYRLSQKHSDTTVASPKTPCTTKKNML